MRRIVTLIGTLAGTAAMLASGPAGPAIAAQAKPASSAIAGFALIDGPGATNPATTYDSAGGTVSATESVSGFFTVTFGGLAFPAGDVQVSGLDPQGSCVIAGWGPAGSDLSVGVDCYHLGVPSDEQFDVLVTKPASAPSGVLDYAWDNRKASSGMLRNPYSYNSSGKSNSSTHLGAGRYLVTMTAPAVTGANTGTVKISAYGGGAGNCELASWRSTVTSQQLGVDCFNGSGVLADREFTIAYARGNNLMGSNGKIDANALASGTQVVYSPPVQFDSAAHARVTVLHLGTGYYEVVAAGSNPTHHANGGDGDAQVTVSGTRYVTCGVFQPGTHQPTFYVSCDNAAGHPASAAFTIQWVITS